MGGDGRQVGGSLGEDAPLEPDDVVLGQQVRVVGQAAPRARLVHPATHVPLDLVDRVLETLGHGVSAKRLHVEAACRVCVSTKFH